MKRNEMKRNETKQNTNRTINTPAKERDLFVCLWVCLSGYAFSRALIYGADIWQVGRGRQPEVY